MATCAVYKAACSQSLGLWRFESCFRNQHRRYVGTVGGVEGAIKFSGIVNSQRSSPLTVSNTNCIKLPVKALLGIEGSVTRVKSTHLDLQGIKYAVSVVVHLPED